MKQPRLKSFAITTLGCKVNQAESDAIARFLKKAGLQETRTGSQSSQTQVDVCIINTCAVTRKAAMQSRQAVRKAIRTHSRARVFVTGCYAQMDADTIKGITGVKRVIANHQKHQIPELILPADQRPCSKTRTSQWAALPPRFSMEENRTRPALKIQDGCNSFCTYCIVPHARGRSRSMPVSEVLNHLDGFQRAGYREVVLSGIHLGAYGHDLSPSTDLAALLRRISANQRIERLRLSSIEPNELTDEILHLAAGSGSGPVEICHHFHVPLQSGDDAILKRMHRPYTRKFFRDRILSIREIIPDAAIGVDILVGFPGESNAAFENTCRLIAALPVSYLHVFPFSPRPSTSAGQYPDQITADIIKARCGKLRRLGNLKRSQFYRSFKGKTLRILIEGFVESASGKLKGMSSNYIPVLIPGCNNSSNQFVDVKVREVDENNLVFGRIL